MKRNTAFDLLKVFFILVVILHHSGYFYGVLNRGYIAVEFFFITSGFFLHQMVEMHPDMTMIQYLKRRLKKLYPGYILAHIIFLIEFLITHSELPYEHWYSPILEVLMLHNLGIPGSAGINYPTWYLSILFVGGCIIYIFIKNLPRGIFNVVAMVIIVCTYSYLMFYSPHIEQWERVGHIFYVPFWRGMADMLIGVLIYQLREPSPFVGIILEWCSGIGILVFLRLSGEYDYLTVILIASLIYAIQSEYSILRKVGKNKVVTWLGKYEYNAYLNHAVVITIFSKIQFIQRVPGMLIVVILLISILILSIVVTSVINYFNRLINKMLST